MFLEFTGGPKGWHTQVEHRRISAFVNIGISAAAASLKRKSTWETLKADDGKARSRSCSPEH